MAIPTGPHHSLMAASVEKAWNTKSFGALNDLVMENVVILICF